MLAVECVFYPNEFILRNNIDYKTIYLSKYFNSFRLKQVALYEYNNSLRYITENDQSKSLINLTITQLLCDAVQTTTIDEDRVFKYLFHGLRYLDFGEQLIRTKSIEDFKRASYLLYEIKDIYVNNHKNADYVVDYIQTISEKYKTMLNQLVPTNIIDGTFKIHITVDNHNMKHFLNICQINKWKSIFIYLNNGYHSKQLMTSFHLNGKYPNIIQQIQTLIDTHFKDLNIIRLKIKSLVFNDGVPDYKIDKLLFWDKKTNYFEFHYQILIKSIEELQKLNLDNIHLAHNQFKKISENEMYYILTMRLFNVGKNKALIQNNSTIQYLTNHSFPPLKVESQFVVYDSNIDLDNGWSHIIPTRSTADSPANSTRRQYCFCIGGKNRKVPDRSTN
jgi:hypothetical protein